MFQTAQKKTYSFEDYLAYQDSTNNQYELVNGELIAMPPASGLHALIMVFLLKQFNREIERLSLNWEVVPGNVGVRTGVNKARIPDLVILTQNQCEEIRSLPTAVLQSSPQLAGEIVSAGNSEDDYRYKRSEYAVREIPEYWIVDPLAKKVSVLLLNNGFYDLTEFMQQQVILSRTFPELKLIVEQVLR